MSLLSLISGLFSPDFMAVLNEIMKQNKISRAREQASNIDQAFVKAEKDKSTEALAAEVGKLIQ